jgi:DNA-binding IclR family transcriptional regulator
MTAGDRGPVRTLSRALDLLELLSARAAGAGVTELAQEAGLDNGTTSRLLAALRERGYVRQRADRRYVLNGKVLVLARGYEAQLDLRDIAHPHLVRLRERTSETVHLAVRDGTHVVYVDQLEPDRSVRIASALGSRRPMHLTALGRAVLAALPEGECDELLGTLLGHEAGPDDRDLVADLERVRDEIAHARRHGWASAERHDDVCRIGVAVREAGGRPVGGVSVSGPRYRMLQHVEQCAEAALAAAAAISADLGA